MAAGKTVGRLRRDREPQTWTIDGAFREKTYMRSWWLRPRLCDEKPVSLVRLSHHRPGHASAATPQIALLIGGELTEFHEWEETHTTKIIGTLAARTSRYAKAGRFHGDPYSGTGTKFFQLAKVSSDWQIVALSWIDHLTIS